MATLKTQTMDATNTTMNTHSQPPTILRTCLPQCVIPTYLLAFKKAKRPLGSYHAREGGAMVVPEMG
jgi:hypothetical protein